jgi:hypothetical protein
VGIGCKRHGQVRRVQGNKNEDAGVLQSKHLDCDLLEDMAAEIIQCTSTNVRILATGRVLNNSLQKACKRVTNRNAVSYSYSYSSQQSNLLMLLTQVPPLVPNCNKDATTIFTGTAGAREGSVCGAAYCVKNALQALPDRL